MQLLSTGNNTVDMVYPDFAKAFDKVDHGVFLHKIKMLGITGKLGIWLYFHISNLNKRTKHLTGWILRTFSSLDKLTMLTLFKALVMSQLDYGSQLWSPT